jgi:hypothetical protein
VHNEAWPSARTNHYLFDLNRDWLPLVHPESRARIDEYHRWLPHVLTDQHERSRDGYFFQPGVPSRQNPLTPDANLDLTRALANFHAKAMDEAGEIYFTEDDYDDFYYGKGSTYPDINGSIGILYEQPSIKGPVLERDTGLLTFVNAIQNHLRTTLSTLHGSLELKDRLKSYQGDFFKTMARRAADADHAAWIIGDDNDPARARAFLEVMDHHRIEYRALAETVDADGQRYVPGHAWVFPVRQRQFGLLEAIMETRTQFEDDTFYDVSAWTQPLAYNLPYARLQRMPETGAPGPGHETTNLSRESIAWIVPWRQMQAPALLQRLLEGGALVRAATKPFTAAGPGGSKTFARGALVIHAGLQGEAQADRAFALLSSAVENGTQVFGTSSALTPSGPDLGALHFKRIWPIRPLMIVGNGVEQYQAGHAWYQFDQRLGLAPVMVDMYQLRSIRLSDYTHLVMVGGNYGQISASVQQRIVQWVKEGGILVASDKASTWAESLCFGSADSCRKASDSEEETAAESAPYARFNDDKAQQNIGGAIVATRADTTHPLAYGLSRQDLPLFRRGTTLLSPSDNPYSTPVRYAEEPLLGGFIGPQQQDHIRGKPAVIAEKKGDGLVVRFANNPVFRGFWRGTERLFNNALYMGQIVENTELPD